MTEPLGVFFYEAFEEEVPLLKRHLPGDMRFGFSSKTIQDENHATPPAPLISIRTQSIIPAGWAPKLKGVLARTTGVDHLLAYRRNLRTPVALAALPAYCSRAVAEQAALMWMALMRKLPRQIAAFLRFDRDGLTGAECQHRRLLVVGVGDIGHEVTRIGAGLGMRVAGVDLVQRHQDVAYVSWQDGAPEADVMVCAMNLTDANVNYFRYETLRHAKRGTIFINIARGEMSPAPDLLRLLDDGILGGIGLDVFNDESRIATALRKEERLSSPEFEALLKLRDHPRALLTPHNAFNTTEALNLKAELSARQVAHFIQHHAFLWPLS